MLDLPPPSFNEPQTTLSSHFERKILVHNQQFKCKSQKFKSEPTAKKLKGIFPEGYLANENNIIVVVIICCHQWSLWTLVGGQLVSQRIREVKSLFEKSKELGDTICWGTQCLRHYLLLTTDIVVAVIIIMSKYNLILIILITCHICTSAAKRRNRCVSQNWPRQK